VQTCALPIYKAPACTPSGGAGPSDGMCGAGSAGGFARFARSRLLARGENHDHLSAFQLRHGLDLAEFDEVVAHAFEYTHAQFLVRHFAAAETQGHFGFVAFLDEAAQVAQLDLVV